MEALREFVRLLVAGPDASGFNLAGGSDYLKRLATYSSNRVGRHIGGLGWSEIAALLVTHKDFWNAVPVTVFDEACLDVRPLARQMAITLFGAAHQTDVDALTVVLKRLRRYWIHGRVHASISRREIRRLLQRQSGRCVTCGYSFSSADLAAREYEAEPKASAQMAGLRPPHVDHVVPIFLGGTGDSNLQILCALCNSGKGAAIAWPFKSAVLKPSRPSELLSPSAGLRWMILESARCCSRCTRDADAMRIGEELTIARVDLSRGWVVENVQAVCTSCV